MEFLVTMTTHVPPGTSADAVADVRSREAARSKELAQEGHQLRRWRTDEVTPLSTHPNDPALAGSSTPS
jgi:muconolactone D-isomerase